MKISEALFSRAFDAMMGYYRLYLCVEIKCFQEVLKHVFLWLNMSAGDVHLGC